MKKRYEDGVVPQLNQNVRAEFAKQMRDARLSQHLSQQSLAERVGTHRSNISRMESGRYNPSLDFMVRVAQCMDHEVSIRIDHQGRDRDA